MSMFGPLSRLRASRQQDVSGMDPYGSGQPMAPAPMDWAEHLRRTAGVRREQANPVQQAYDAKLAEYAPQQAENVPIPAGMDIRRRFNELQNEKFRLLSMGGPDVIAKRRMLEGEQVPLRDMIAADNIQSRYGGEFTGALPQNDANTLTRGEYARQKLTDILQQRADDELMTRNRQKADMRLADEGKALEAASNTAKLQMLVNAARKGASDADLAEIMASPDVLGRRLNREDKAAAQQSELADLQIQSARNKVNQERDAYDPQLAADEKTLRRLDVQSKLMQARAGNDIEGKSINFEKALADPQFKDLAETTSVLAAQLIADGNNEVGGDTLLSSVEQLNKYLASMPAADAKRMAGYIRTQLAKAGVKRLDTDFFTKGSAYFNPLRFTQYDTQRKSQQAVKALEYVLSKAGEPAE